LKNIDHVKQMSGGIAPSKSTVYIANLDYSLTNNDLHTIFGKFGQIAKVTIVKDKTTRESQGLAFILFVKREDAQACVRVMHLTTLNERIIKVSIAQDNGRAREFIKRKVYKDKTRCYECGEEGHLSYECPKNILGARPRPQKKKKRKDSDGGEIDYDDEDSDDSIYRPPPPPPPSLPPPTPAQSLSVPSHVPIGEHSGQSVLRPRPRVLPLASELVFGSTSSQSEGNGSASRRNPFAAPKRVKSESYFSDEEN